MLEKKKQSIKSTNTLGKQRSYSEIVEFFDSNWSNKQDSTTLNTAKKLSKAFGDIAEKVPAILVAGTNGKSITIQLAVKLLKEEGLKVGSFYSPHVLTYNERIAVGPETISNKKFTEVANEVINTAEQLKIKANSAELLTITALKYFKDQEVDVAILEVSKGGKYNPVNICNAKVAAITRVTASKSDQTDEDVKENLNDMLGIVKPNTWLVSGDQNKSHLQFMQDTTESQNGNWAMPIRKLAALSYPFEQLHGRCAAISERIAQLFIENYVIQDAEVITETLLTKPKGQRGRPTLEAKRQLELNPKKTMEQFWKDTNCTLPGRFELLDKEKPSILLDNANNIDALKNLLLGIRLLHYQRPLKGLALIAGATKETLQNEEFFKLIRYFFKKTSGQLYICPIEDSIPGTEEENSWDIEKVANDIKSLKIKANACKSFEEAFEAAKKSVDPRDGAIVITGSKSIINSYWKLKGIKKF